MSYDTLKLILWGLLCVPVLAVSFWAFSNLLKESLEVEKGKKRKKTKAQKQQEAVDAAQKAAEKEYMAYYRNDFDKKYKETHGI